MSTCNIEIIQWDIFEANLNYQLQEDDLQVQGDISQWKVSLLSSATWILTYSIVRIGFAISGFHISCCFTFLRLSYVDFVVGNEWKLQQCLQKNSWMKLCVCVCVHVCACVCIRVCTMKIKPIYTNDTKITAIRPTRQSGQSPSNG